MSKSFKQIIVLSISLSFIITISFSISSLFVKANQHEVSAYHEIGKVNYKPLSNEFTETVKKEPLSYNFIKIGDFETIYELIAILEGYGISSDKVINVMNDKNTYQSFQQKFSFLPPYDSEIIYSLEGYLMPGEYKYEEGDLTDLFEQMLVKTDTLLREATNDYTHPLLKRYEMSEIITLASMVEQESDITEDRRNIAGVFFNRLERNMPLQSDVSAMYVRNLEKVSAEDLNEKSPYNTYHVDGLPIGPINTPSLDSINAVLYYTDNDYLFFIGTGVETLFSTTYEEHKDLIAIHLQ